MRKFQINYTISRLKRFCLTSDSKTHLMFWTDRRPGPQFITGYQNRVQLFSPSLEWGNVADVEHMLIR